MPLKKEIPFEPPVVRSVSQTSRERKTFRVVSLKVLPAPTVATAKRAPIVEYYVFDLCFTKIRIGLRRPSAYCVQFPTALSDDGAAFVRNVISRRCKLKNVFATGAHAAGESNVSRRIRTRYWVRRVKRKSADYSSTIIKNEGEGMGLEQGWRTYGTKVARWPNFNGTQK